MNKSFAEKIAIASVVVGIGTMSVLGGVGMAQAQAATPTPSQCTTSVQWVMGQQVHAHYKSTMALRSNADALKRYPNCGALSPQQLNVIVGGNATVKADGAKIYTHWHK